MNWKRVETLMSIVSGESSIHSIFRAHRCQGTVLSMADPLLLKDEEAKGRSDQWGE